MLTLSQNKLVINKQTDKKLVINNKGIISKEMLSSPRTQQAGHVITPEVIETMKKNKC